MIGFLGEEIVFETNDQRILTFSGFTRESNSRWGYHKRIGAKPASEYMGPELDVIRFTVLLRGTFGVKPREEMVKWLVICREGTAHSLVIEGKALGVDKWIVRKVSQMWDVVMNDGKLMSGRIEVELEEYMEWLG